MCTQLHCLPGYSMHCTHVCDAIFPGQNPSVLETGIPGVELGEGGEVHWLLYHSLVPAGSHGPGQGLWVSPVEGAGQSVWPAPSTGSQDQDRD